MKADIFYSSAPGRILFKVLEKAGFFRLASRFLRTRLSKHMIPGYIKKYRIDMKPFAGQTYDSFAAFFSRKRAGIHYVADQNVLISPCDGLLSVYTVTDDLEIHMKGSVYTMTDLVPEYDIAESFRDGLCLVFRLEASDYHHFCCFDDGTLIQTSYIPGQLQSVQPVAQRSSPVFRLNRRWWSVVETKHFGTTVQIEVGAVLVGNVSFFIQDASFRRGDDMGCFELAGSTVILILSSTVRESLVFRKSLLPAMDGKNEVCVKMGSAIGILKNYE